MASSYCSCAVGIIVLTIAGIAGLCCPRKRGDLRPRDSRVFRTTPPAVVVPAGSYLKMTLPIQLISTDFDGTLHADFENPPVPHDLQALIGDLQRQGAKWVINTGRDLSSVMEGMARARLTIKPDYLVVVERDIYIHHGSQYEPCAEWNGACRRAHDELFARVQADVPRLVDWVGKRFRAELYDDDFSPFCLIAETNEDADAIQGFLDAYCATVPNLTLVRNDVYARFSHCAYNKGTTLGEIATRLGVSREHTLAAGDH